MEIKTFDTVLNELLTDFDKTISPKKIARKNTNIIYLLFKAEAKGLEVLHNTLLSVKNKFDPERCLDEDLESVAKLVGTERLKGSASGLELVIKNRTEETVIFPAGLYSYKLNDTDVFQFEQTLPENITAENRQIVKIAISTSLRPIPVTAQTNIKLEGITAGGLYIDMSKFEVDCRDNQFLLGTTPEDNLSFRERIVSGQSAASLFNKMREEIVNLPYVFDCQLVFNNSTGDKQEGDITIPPYHLLIVLSGSPKNEIAEIVAKYGTYETVNVPEEGKLLKYYNDIFIDGEYDIYYIKPREHKYSLNIYFEADPKAITDTTIEKTIDNALVKYRNINTFVPYITEREFSNYLMSLGMSTVHIMNVDIADSDGQIKDYIKFNKLELAQLDSFTIHNVTNGE